MKLLDVLDGLDVRSIRGDANTVVSSVTADSRECKPGSLFIAIAGLARDGLAFVPDAVRRGASVVVAELPVESIGCSVLVLDARIAAAVIAANFHGRPAERLKLIGVTGTSGKTTTTRMIESMIDATGAPAGLIGTIEYRAGKIREIADRTTPDAIVLQEWLARMVHESVRHAVMEVSSHALALRRTHGIHFAAAVFTNLSRDHFDFHSGYDDYFAAKKLLFDQIDRTGRTAVVNTDDGRGRVLADELGPVAITFGLGDDADVHPVSGFQSTIEGLDGTVITPFGEVRLHSPLIGTPNLYNWLAAIGAALSVGIDRDAVEQGIAGLASVRGRFERVASARGTVLIDYAHKPDALEKLLETVRSMSPGRRIVVVFGCGGDRDQGKRAVMGEIAARMADLTIVTSDNPRSESPEAITRQIEQGLRSVSAAEWETIIDRRTAIARAIDLLDDQTIVVIAGKGHETYQVVGDRILHFDDREEVEQALREKRYESGDVDPNENTREKDD